MKSKDTNAKAKLQLQAGLKKFKEDALKKGWEEDEVQEKITEVFENFPWYKFTRKTKSLKSKIFKFLLYLFIIYLAFSAVLERNKRLKKRYTDFIHDNEIIYHQTRILRFLTLPIFKIYDLSKFHNSECLIKNPFVKEEGYNCELCENIYGIDTVDEVNGLDTKIDLGRPIVVAKYNNDKGDVSYNLIKELFKNNGQEMDDSICEIWLNKDYEKMSDFFLKFSEEEVRNNNISIAWKNCHTYGTRFYRRLFPRPDFISNTSEISLEKTMLILQKNMNVSLSSVGQGELTYVMQVQGESVIELLAPESCSFNCSTTALSKNLKQRDIIIFPSSFWKVSLKSISDDSSIIYQSTYT